MRKISKEARLYFLAALAAVAALVLRRFLDPLLAAQNPYHTIWLAIVFSAFYCGIGPTIVCAAVGLLGIWYWFLPPYHSFAGKNHIEIFGMLGFIVFSAVIAVLGESTRRSIAKREEAEEALRKSQQELENRVKERTAALEQNAAEISEKAALLDLANDAIFVKAADGKISYWNQGAERLYGWTRSEALGRFPAELLHSEYPIPLQEIESKDDWQGEIRHTTRNGSRIVVASRWTTVRNHDGERVAWLEINTDVTSQRRAEQAARSLSARILTLQDEERRKIARGLHDSLGQYLAGLKMNLDRLVTADGNRETLASECFEIIEKCMTETRTISHLLHPPLLDEAGLSSAARWYVDGFAQRSGIQVNIELPPKLERLPRDVETALFRGLQECLTNVHRHSGASAVDIRLRTETERVHLEITDNGRGIPKSQLIHLTDGNGESGIGIAGMRERVRQLGGSLEIRSDTRGTGVIVSIPLVQRVPVDSVQDRETTHRDYVA